MPVRILSYYYMPRPPMRVQWLPPQQEYYYQPPAERYVYQPPAEEVLVEQPPELYYLPPPEVQYFEVPPQRYMYQPPPQELYYQPPPQPYYYQPPPQRVTCAPSMPPEPSYAQVPSHLDVTYREPQPIEYGPYQYLVGADMYWPDLRSPPIALGVRAVPSSVRIYHPRELPIKG